MKSFHVVSRNDQAQVLVTTGTGKFYSNGMDLKWMTALARAGKEQEIWDGLQDVTTLLARILTFPMPTVAALNGSYHSLLSPLP